MQANASPRSTVGFLGNKKRVFWGLGVVVAAVIILTGFFYNRHNIRIFADGKEVNVVMRGGTVAESLKKANISLGERDLIEPALDTKLADDLTVRITRKLCITLADAGEASEQWVTPGNVGQALEELKITVNSSDKVVPEPSTVIKSGDTIEISRFSDKFIEESIKVPFKLERRNDNLMEKGTTRIVRKGQDGLIQKTIKITYRNGEEIKREVVAEKVLREPVAKIVAYGTVTVKEISRGGQINFSRALSMTATAYTHTGNNTASGIYPYRGAVAVDPSVIKMGTRLYVEGYGYAKALDIGSAIKGNRIDLFFDTEKEARKWGRRIVKVYVLE
ncbi:3D domain-containing protein [Phosphitispora sp. TUW77]|uniref:3D domain-containing protein n=1 Tax=Phosphitispora sp. TUW77 TaxID=3152361 RepID=UPI003AB38A19